MSQDESEVERVAVVSLEEIESMDDQCSLYVGTYRDYSRCQNDATHVEVNEYNGVRKTIPVCSDHA